MPADILKSLELFKELNETQLNHIADICFQAEYAQGDRLFKEKENAHSLWINYNGTIELRFELPGSSATSSDQTISTISGSPDNAQLLGWSCLVPPYKYRLSSYCVSPRCQVFKIDKTDLFRLFEKDHAIGYFLLSKLIKIVGSRFIDLQDHLARIKGEDLLNQW